MTNIGLSYIQDSLLKLGFTSSTCELINNFAQVREYKTPSADCGDLSTAQVEQLKRDVESKKTGLEQWSKTAFEEVRRLDLCLNQRPRSHNTLVLSGLQLMGSLDCHPIVRREHPPIRSPTCVSSSSACAS